MKQTVALVIYSNPDYYPPVYYIARRLAAEYNVLLICRDIDEPLIEYGPGVTVLRVGNRQPREKKFTRQYVHKSFDFLRFIFRVVWNVRRTHCRLIYACDAHGFNAGFLASRCGTKVSLVYHNFDLGSWDDYRGCTKFLKWFEITYAKYAEMVVFCSHQRAEEFVKESGLLRFPLIVMNAPQMLACLPESRLIKEAVLRGVPRDSTILLYAGVISDVSCAGEIIRSVPLWPAHTVLCMIGMLHATFRDTLEKLLQEHSLQNRVFVWPYVPFTELFPQMVMGAKLGFGLYKPINTNFSTMAGASNKVLQYFSLGIPAIVNNSPDYMQAFGDSLVYGVDCADPVDIARAVNAAISDDDAYRKKSFACRQRHLEQLNFEEQFAPLAAFIKEQMGHA